MQTPGPFGEVSASRGGEGAKGRSRWSRNGQSLLAAGPVVRIHLPPADSPGLAQTELPQVENRGFPAGVRRRAGGAVGRDAQARRERPHQH